MRLNRRKIREGGCEAGRGLPADCAAALAEKRASFPNLEQLGELDKSSSFDLAIWIAHPEVPRHPGQNGLDLLQLFRRLDVEVPLGQVGFDGVVAAVGKPKHEVGELQHGVAFDLGQGQQRV